MCYIACKQSITKRSMSRTTKHKRHQYNDGKPFQGKNPPKDLPQDDDKPSTICSPQEPITMSQDDPQEVPPTNETLEWFPR